MDVTIVAIITLAVGLIAYTFLHGAGIQSNPSYLVQLAQNAGFVGQDANIAAAIAIAESSGNPKAIGDNGTSYGLWQIHYTVHPEFDPQSLFDPAYNASAAFQIYSIRGGFQDWSTYNTGTYEKYLNDNGEVIA